MKEPGIATRCDEDASANDRALAEKALAQELFDALWMENLHNFRHFCSVHGAREIKVEIDDQTHVVVPAAWRDRLRPIELLGWPPHRVQKGARKATDLAQLICELQKAHWWPAAVEATRLSAHAYLARRRLSYFLARETDLLNGLASARTVSLQQWEALSCLRDRPFHPLSHAKSGWRREDEQRYGCFAAAPIRLNWVAVPRAQLLTERDMAPALPENIQASAHRVDDVARELLGDDDYQLLLGAMARAGRGPDQYRALPVHPWQWRWLNQPPQQSSRPWLRHCVPLCADRDHGETLLSLAEVEATASLRTLALTHRPHWHIKLACSVGALGAIRTQPPRYLQNGILAQSVLRGLMADDDWLQQHLWLCEELNWGAVVTHPGDTTGPGDRWNAENGEISYLLRRLPGILLRDRDTALIPLSAFAVLSTTGRAPAWQRCAKARAQATPPLCAPTEAAVQLFTEIVSLLVELGYRCLRNGVMPELHGQNVVLVIRAGKPRGLLLRDHDTLRICPGLMASAGRRAPLYLIDRQTPNTLVLETPQQLFAYFQTLVLQVNVYAMAATLSASLSLPEDPFWRIVAHLLHEKLTLLPASGGLKPSVRGWLQASSWPFKRILSPLLLQRKSGTGMPGDMGLIENPLLQWGRS